MNYYSNRVNIRIGDQNLKVWRRDYKWQWERCRVYLIWKVLLKRIDNCLIVYQLDIKSKIQLVIMVRINVKSNNRIKLLVRLGNKYRKYQV